MSKVHPKTLVPITSPYLSSEQETFTIWMKSLVLNGKGCTVFDSAGDIVYRVDNYNYSHEVHLMDFRGKVLFTIMRKKFMFRGLWSGYRSTDREIGRGKADFQVRRTFRGLKTNSSICYVTKGLDKNQSNYYKIERRCTDKSTCKILNESGLLIAEVKRKQSSSGVLLGEDVLTMVVEPSIDQSLVMGLVVTYNLINSNM